MPFSRDPAARSDRREWRKLGRNGIDRNAALLRSQSRKREALRLRGLSACRISIHIRPTDQRADHRSINLAEDTGDRPTEGKRLCKSTPL